MKKVMSIVLALAMVVSCVAMVQLVSFAAAEDGSFKYDFENDANVDAIFGTYGGRKEVVTAETGKVHSGNKAIKFSGGDADYQGIKINPAIMKTVTNGKAGVYRFSAWYYFETVPADVKSVGLNSRVSWGGAAAAEAGKNFYQSEQLPIKEGGWKKYTFYLNLNQNWVDDSEIDLCLSESAGRTVYYVDDIELTRFEPVENAKGVEYTVTDFNDSQMGPVIMDTSFSTDLSYLAAKAVDGVVTLRFRIYNTGDVTLGFEASAQVGWSYLGLDGGCDLKKEFVEPNTCKDVSFSFNVDADGKVTKESDGTKVDMTNATLRVNFYNKDGGVGVDSENAKFVVQPLDEDNINALRNIKGIAVDFVGVAELPDMTPATPTPDGGEETPTPGEEATPTPKPITGFTAKLIADVTDAGSGQWFITDYNVVSDSDVSGGKLTLRIPVKNIGNQDIRVRFELQAVHKKGNGDAVWAGPVSMPYVDIPAGETVEIEYTADVNNGKITVDAYDNSADYNLTDFFARIDIKNKDDGDLFEKGMAFTIYVNENMAKQFMELREGNNKGSFYECEYAYDAPSTSKPTVSGDVLPIAFIAITVIAAVALIVVSKKKRMTE